MRDPSLTQIVALVAFAGTYLGGLAIGHLPLVRVDRTGVAIIGAALMVVAGVIPWDRAVAAVDVHTLALLFGMMIVTAYLRLRLLQPGHGVDGPAGPHTTERRAAPHRRRSRLRSACPSAGGRDDVARGVKALDELIEASSPAASRGA